MGVFLERHVKRFQKSLSEPGLINDVLTFAEPSIGVDRIYIAPGAIGFLAVYLAVGFGAQLVCNIIGFIYPAYASIKAIETKTKDDDTKWLTYWVVYSCFSMVEFFSDILLSWFPLYWLAKYNNQVFLKCAFLIFCFAPTSWNGSTIIYQGIIRPIFLNYEPEIEQVATMVESKIEQVATMVESETEQVSTIDLAASKLLSALIQEKFVANAQALGDSINDFNYL